MSARRLRLLAVLPPAALILHEGAFAISGGGLRPSHEYLHLAIPLVAVLAAAAVLAAILAPLFGRPGEREPRAHAAASVSAALIAIFVVQELVEVVLLGGGPAALAASAAAAWALLPLALLLGILSTVLIASLERASALILRLADRRLRRRRSRARQLRPFRISSPRPSPLAFGLACRPPPEPLASR